MILPNEFIEALEDTDLIIPVGSWIVKECVLFLKKLQKRYPEIGLSFNVSVKELHYGEVVKTLEKVFEETGVPAEKLEVEITENLFLETESQAWEAVNRLHKLGVKIVIDDFGTGYSSLVYLKRFPAHVLKIDYLFVRGIPESREDAGLVMSIVGIAKNLGKMTVAEGVERREQLAFLMGLGVDQVQGFYFAPPMPEKEVFKFLDNFQPERYF